MSSLSDIGRALALANSNGGSSRLRGLSFFVAARVLASEIANEIEKDETDAKTLAGEILSQTADKKKGDDL